MPQVTDPTLLQALNGGGQPQPVPQPRFPGVIQGNPDPYKANADARAQTDQSLQIQTAKIARDKAARDKLEWDATHNPDGTPKVAQGAGKALRNSDVTELNKMGDGLASFARLNSTFTDNFAGNTVTGGLENTIQSSFSGLGTPGQQQWWSDMATYDNAIRNDLFGASLTPGEKAEFFKTTVNPSMDPVIVKANLKRREEILQGSALRRVTGLKAAGWNKEEIDAYIGGNLADPASTPPPPPPGGDQGAMSPAPNVNADPRATGNIPGGDGGTPMALAQGGTKTAALSGVENQYRQMLRDGASGDELVAYLQGVGLQDEAGLMQARQQARYRDQFPKVPIEKYPVSFLREVPLSAADQAINAAGQSAAGAYAMNAAQGVTAGTLDEIIGMTGGNQERARAGMAAVSAANPGFATLGAVSGGVMAAMGGEAALARAGIGAGLTRGVASDAIYGAASGAGNADNGNRLGNALAGAALGGGTSLAASGGVNALALGLTPTGRGAEELYAAGVRPTIGQRGAAMADQGGLRGAVGRFVSDAEQKLQSVPVIGSAIRGARQEARDQFQIGAFNEALKEVGEALPKGMKPGTAPNAYAQKTFDRVYAQARAGMIMRADNELAQDLNALAPDLAVLGPQATTKFKAVMDNFVNNRAVNGELSGDAFKRTVSDLDKKIAAFRKGTTSEDQGLADAVENVKMALESAARRHSDPDSVALLDAADAGYAKLVRIEGAAARAGGDAGTFTPSGFDREVQKQAGTVRSKSFLRGDALMQDFANQGKALSDTVPDSGTAGRAALLGGAAGAASYFSPTAATFFGGLLAAYAPGSRKVMQAALSPAGPRRQEIARQLQKRARLVGSTSAASAGALSQGTASVP
jgi:hypothetical protein